MSLTIKLSSSKKYEVYLETVCRRERSSSEEVDLSGFYRAIVYLENHNDPMKEINAEIISAGKIISRLWVKHLPPCDMLVEGSTPKADV